MPSTLRPSIMFSGALGSLQRKECCVIAFIIVVVVVIVGDTVKKRKNAENCNETVSIEYKSNHKM